MASDHLQWGHQAPTSPSHCGTDHCPLCHLSHRCRQMTYSDDLPQISVVFIFVNEALSVILRSVHSVVNHTPSQLLKEVILVDDNSDNGELLGNLLEPGGWRTAFGMWQGHVPPRGSRGGYFLPLPASGADGALGVLGLWPHPSHPPPSA